MSLETLFLALKDDRKKKKRYMCSFIIPVYDGISFSVLVFKCCFPEKMHGYDVHILHFWDQTARVS